VTSRRKALLLLGLGAASTFVDLPALAQEAPATGGAPTTGGTAGTAGAQKQEELQECSAAKGEAQVEQRLQKQRQPEQRPVSS